MKKRDVLIIILLIFAPVFIGLLQVAAMQGGSAKKRNFLTHFQKKIGVISLQGVIYSSDSFVRQLKKFRDDNSVSGLIIYVNSPGGAVAPSQEIYQEIRRFKKDTGKPVYISMGTVAASGGYYIAAAGDKIFANSGTLTGSIGVIMQFSHYYDLLKKVGVDVSTITAGQLKDAGSPYRELRGNEKQYFDALLKDTHEQFIKDISEGREMEIDSLRQYTEGQIFTGNMALEFGLVDTIATFEECKIAMRDALHLPKNTEFVSAAEHELSAFERLFETKSFVKSVTERLLPRSGAYYLATELQ